jgi:DNA-binding CsgD family transcriptional regulator
MQHHAEVALTASMLSAYETAIEALGSAQFPLAATTAVQRLAHVDRFYVFDIPSGAKALRSLIQFYEPEKPRVSSFTYARHYMPLDPVWRAISTARSKSAIQVRCGPGDIIVDAYRRMLERCDIVERVSFLRPIVSGWRCMTVARTRKSGPFDDEEVAVLGGFAGLLMPMINRNETLSMHGNKSPDHDVAELEGRFARLFPDLTGRERQTCARAAIGMTVEGAALDLDIATSSILTYRKRAYRRLGVTSAYELARLVMR